MRQIDKLMSVEVVLGDPEYSECNIGDSESKR
jgi:hypothetical protein